MPPKPIVPRGSTVRRDELGYAVARAQIPVKAIKAKEIDPVLLEKRTQKFLKLLKQGKRCGNGLPVIQVYGRRYSGDFYQVFDGHARVSAYRKRRLKWIEADVLLVHRSGRPAKYSLVKTRRQ